MFICIYPLVEFYTLQISLIECSIICNQPAQKKGEPSWFSFFCYLMIVASRSGPTEMILIGTPRKFSMNAI